MVIWIFYPFFWIVVLAPIVGLGLVLYWIMDARKAWEVPLHDDLTLTDEEIEEFLESQS